MLAHQPTEFLSGVIEGFYGQPWSQAERFELFDRMAVWGLNTYFYAPKDDLKHRALWREPYSDSESATLRELIEGCRSRGIRFIYGLAPGLDIRYSSEAELALLRARFEQMLRLGCRDFALLFDDIPDRMDPADAARFDSFASAQCSVVNQIFAWTRAQIPGGRSLFCPTPYCGRMALRKLGGEGYLSIIGRELAKEIDVFWTGPEIISGEITVEHIAELQTQLRRKPVIWDNLHANDYDGRRMYLGPYAGRPLELRTSVKGLLLNSNNELALNFMSFCTLAAFVHANEAWDPRSAYLKALQEWLPSFATLSKQMGLEDLILLCDCYYLPFEEGAEAVAFLSRLRAVVSGAAEPQSDEFLAVRKLVNRLREACARIAELRERRLFYALSRRIWELREELDLLERCLAAKAIDPAVPFTSDFHLPGTYRGGLVPKLQRLLIQHPDGAFTPRTNES